MVISNSIAPDTRSDGAKLLDDIALLHERVYAALFHIPWFALPPSGHEAAKIARRHMEQAAAALESLTAQVRP